MDIRIEFSQAALWGDVDPEGYDEAYSANKFAAQVGCALEEIFPDADVEVIEDINDRHSVDGMEDSDDADDVGEVINQVWQAFDWMVKN